MASKNESKTEPDAEKEAMPPCPACGSNESVIPIVFGYPSPGLMDMANQGKVLLGGCCPPMTDEVGKLKNLHCKKCFKSF